MKKIKIKESDIKLMVEGLTNDVINEVGGYDDPNMMIQHGGAYMGMVARYYETIRRSLRGLELIESDILDDGLRKSIDEMITDTVKHLKKIKFYYLEAEKNITSDLKKHDERGKI